MQDLTCAKCSKLSNKILALECQHNLCIPCATKIANRHSTSQQIRQIECEICGSISVIHRSAKNQLSSAQNAAKSREFQLSRIAEESPIKQEIESMLFCLDCQKPCFSIDDYLSGMHSGHNVKNVKRSGSILKQLLGELDSKIKQRVQVAVSESNKLIERKRDLVQNFGLMKKTLKQHFQKMRNLLLEKQEELLNVVEESMVSLFSYVDNSIIEVKHYLSRFETVHNQLQHHLSLENKTKGFNYFSDRKQDILQQISYPIERLSRQTLDNVQCLNMNNSILSDSYDYIKGMKLMFAELPISLPKQNLIDDFFEAKRNEVFNQTTKKDFKNTTLTKVKSLETLKPEQVLTKTKTNKGVNERLKQLELLISKSHTRDHKQRYFN